MSMSVFLCRVLILRNQLNETTVLFPSYQLDQNVNCNVGIDSVVLMSVMGRHRHRYRSQNELQFGILTFDCKTVATMIIILDDNHVCEEIKRPLLVDPEQSSKKI